MSRQRLKTFYDPDIKNKFIEMQTQPVAVRCRALFDHAHTEEERLGKDLALFSKDELLNFYSYLNARSVNVLTNYHTTFKQYKRWYKAELDIPADEEDIFVSEIDKTILNAYVNRVAQRKRKVTREDILEWIEQMKKWDTYIARDAFILLALYEGLIIDKFEDARTLGWKDLYEKNGKYYAHTTNGEMAISQELYEYGKESASTDTVKVKGKRGMIRTYELGPDKDKVIKWKVQKNMSTTEVGIYTRISTVIRQVLKNLGVQSYVTVKSIMISGEIDAVNRYAEVHELEVLDYLRSQYFMDEIGYRYGISSYKQLFNHIDNRLRPYL